MKNKSGFTLIELSIVLVIIGLIVGGVLVGRDLIEAARIRAQITQFEQIQTAINTFKLKYNHLPGDMPQVDAEALGLRADPTFGFGNNNGIIDRGRSTHEPNLLWVHLGDLSLINGKYTIGYVNMDTPDVASFLPRAKLSDDLYLYVWAGGPDTCRPGSVCGGNNGINYISMTQSTRYCDFNSCGQWGGNMPLTPAIAYSMDSKMDDGMPQSGRVQAMYAMNNSEAAWAGAEYFTTGLHDAQARPTVAANTRTAANCYDNNGVAGRPQQYSIANTTPTCAISVKF